ncbi:MAG: inositol phosphorylceramide synthase [Deltaproteobacteria bacterium]|nr:inositol phosphorylceramide synthase [Deltaproteobacteria bacterium]
MERTIPLPRGLRQFAVWALLATYLGGMIYGQRIGLGQVGLGAIVALLYFASQATRNFLRTFFPLLLYLLCYDLVHLLPTAWRLPVHVHALHDWELMLFRTLPHEWFTQRHWPIVDALATVTYSLHFIGPVLFGLLLWRRDAETTRRFGWAFFGMNIAAHLIQIGFPTAPPWYVNAHGFATADPLLPGDPGGLARVDAALEMHYFTNMYRMSAIVFGAMPSMHGAWPILMYRFRDGLPRWVGRTLLGYTALMWFAAVYLQHHYVVDLLVGGAMALIFAFIHSRRQRGHRSSPRE